jgi:Flp pilus assembly pilin Flp
MVRRLAADENGLSNLKWALLIAAVAIAAIMYLPPLSFVSTALGQFWSWLTLPAAGP